MGRGAVIEHDSGLGQGRRQGGAHGAHNLFVLFAVEAGAFDDVGDGDGAVELFGQKGGAVQRAVAARGQVGGGENSRGGHEGSVIRRDVRNRIMDADG
ncbi:hypothetical protein D3C78_1712800 [compost metagenome]